MFNDPSAQAAYSSLKHKDENKKLPLKEKIELSWQFLYEITEVVLNKFTPQDQQEVKQQGHKLVENGAKYDHKVDVNIKQSFKKAKKMNLAQEKKAV